MEENESGDRNRFRRDSKFVMKFLWDNFLSRGNLFQNSEKLFTYFLRREVQLFCHTDHVEAFTQNIQFWIQSFYSLVYKNSSLLQNIV